MTPNEIKAQARHETAALILPSLLNANVTKIEADKIYCVEHEIDGKTVYTEITITAKNWTDTKRSKAYNPRDKAAEIEAKKKTKKA